MDASRTGAKFPYCDLVTLEWFDDELAEFAVTHLPRKLPTGFDHAAARVEAGRLLDTVAGWPDADTDGKRRQVFIRDDWRQHVNQWGHNDGLSGLHFARNRNDRGEVNGVRLHPYAASLRNACSELAAYAAGDRLGPDSVRWRALRREVYTHLEYVGKPLPGRGPQYTHPELAELVYALRLKGDQRKSVLEIARHGRVSITRLAMAVEWDNPDNGSKMLVRHLNEKLRKHGWSLSRAGGVIVVKHFGPGAGS